MIKKITINVEQINIQDHTPPCNVEFHLYKTPARIWLLMSKCSFITHSEEEADAIYTGMYTILPVIHTI